MVSLCTDTPLPTFKGLYDSFAGNLTSPPMPFVFPQMPTLPVPMFPSINVPNLEAVKTLIELQSQQMLGTLIAMIAPLVEYLELAIEDLIPKIPGLDLSLIDLLEMNPQALYDAVKQKIIDGVGDLWPFIPLPLYTSLSIPDFEIVQIASNLVKQYSMMLVTFITSLITQVTDALEITNMPTLPSFPTFDNIKALILAKVPGATTPHEVLTSGISIPEMFNILIPGFPALPALPSPLIPSINIPEFDYIEAMGILMNHLNTSGLSLIMDFIEDTLGQFISFTFPTICITL